VNEVISNFFFPNEIKANTKQNYVPVKFTGSVS